MFNMDSLFDCNICYGLDVESFMVRMQHSHNPRRTLKGCRVNEILDSARDGCPGCDLIRKGIEVSAVSNTDPVHIIFEVGLPLRIEGGNTDVEIFVDPGMRRSFLCEALLLIAVSKMTLRLDLALAIPLIPQKSLLRSKQRD
jgi:hypothetical protein